VPRVSPVRFVRQGGRGTRAITTIHVVIARSITPHDDARPGLLGAVVGALIPRAAVVNLLLVVQVVNGVLLPILLVFIIRLINNREVMGAYTNGRVYNALAWITVVSIAGLSVLMVVSTILPALGVHLFEL
jgi:hypothetical protein